MMDLMSKEIIATPQMILISSSRMSQRCIKLQAILSEEVIGKLLMLEELRDFMASYPSLESAAPVISVDQ